MESYVGLDVHSKSSVFVVQNAAGRVYARGEVATTPEGLARLRSEYGLAPGTPIGLETGTVKRLLRAAGLARLSRTLASDAAWTKLFAALPVDPLLRSYIEDHHTVWRCARAQVVRLERVLTEQQKPLRTEIGRLQTVPG